MGRGGAWSVVFSKNGIFRKTIRLARFPAFLVGLGWWWGFLGAYVSFGLCRNGGGERYVLCIYRKC